MVGSRLDSCRRVRRHRRSSEPLDRIGNWPGEDGAQFVLKESGNPFFVKGFNYVRLRAAEGKTGGDHATFDADTSENQGSLRP